MSVVEVRPIDAGTHRAWIAGRASVSFLQTPAWAQVKAEWVSESLGWYCDGRMVGAGLVLYRRVPRLPRSLAYLPEGPDLDWSAAPARDLLTPLIAHCRSRGAFTVKAGPPVATRRWTTPTVKARIAGGVPGRLADVPADDELAPGQDLLRGLAAAGWTRKADSGAGFGDMQPRHVFQLPLAGRTLDEVMTGFNQLWRRNIRKAEKSAVIVERGGYDDLVDFHQVYVETAERDRFHPRGLGYFQRMWRAMHSDDTQQLSLYLARYQGQVVAATTMVRVGDHAWYSYGASSAQGREARPSHAIQWRMISDAHAAGCSVYDLRGISDTLDPADHLFGLIQFKLGTGGYVQEYVGEWDYAVRPLWHKAFQVYLSRRG